MEHEPSLSIRVKPEEIQAIQDIANARGMSRAAFIRRLVLQAILHETQANGGQAHGKAASSNAR
jgi:uncharacterized protein (DUF1778 family)